MSLLDTIQSDMYAAMKSGDKHKSIKPALYVLHFQN